MNVYSAVTMKCRIWFLLCIAVVFCASRAASQECLPIPMVGNIDGDNISMTMADGLALIQYIADPSYPISDPRNADLNGDCVIDCHDVAMFSQYWVMGGGQLSPLALCTCESPVRGDCCCGTRGNVNLDIVNQVTISDLTYLISFLFAGGAAPLCLEEADVNGAGGVTVQDVTTLVRFLFSGGPAPAACL